MDNVYVLVKESADVNFRNRRTGGEYVEIMGIFSSKELAEERRRELYEAGERPEAQVVKYLVDP